MKSTVLLLSVLALIAGLQLSWAQDDVTDCTEISADLGTDAIDPTTDPNLPVCENLRDTAQCCSPDYINDRVVISEEDFLAGLRMELQNRFQAFDDLAVQLRQYIERDFTSSYFTSLGNFNFLNNASALVSEFESKFRENIEFDPEDDDDDEEEDGEEDSDTDGEEDTDANGFNVERFLREVVTRFEDSAAEQFGQDSAETSQCIRGVIEGNIELQRMEAQAQAIQQIRRVLAYIERLRSLVQNFTQDLAGFRPLQDCVNTLVRLNTCGRCVAVRPLFCRNVCGAIARACYSSFNDAMKDEFETLWEVLRRILDAATDALGDLNRNRGLLRVDAATILQEVTATCGLSFGSDRLGRRQSDDDGEDDGSERSRSQGIPLLPDVVRTTARALRGGPFDYEGRRNLGPGLCRRLSTIRANCWDDNEERETDIDEFDGDDIDDQVNNPVIDLDEDELREQADSLGTPITSALNDPSFAQIAPSGLVLPGGDEGNGATQVVFSFTLFAMMLIAGILMI